MKTKEDELLMMFTAMTTTRGRAFTPFMVSVGKLEGIPGKRVAFILGKWHGRGWLTKTNLLTHEGIKAIDELLGEWKPSK